MTNSEKYDLFVIELARGHCDICQEIIDSYDPGPWYECTTKEKMQTRLGWYTGDYEDFSSSTDFSTRRSTMIKHYFPQSDDFTFENPDWTPLPSKEELEEAQEEGDDYREEENIESV